MYMQVERQTGTVLHLKRSPSLRSWSLLIGISSVGLAAGYYSSDTWAWKLFYVAGCVFVAIQNLEDWEVSARARVQDGVLIERDLEMDACRRLA
ncbi:hypothetical protein FKM82_026392, partial [Ascaphus truei]